MAVYGYARVSTQKQSLARQITNITRAEPNIKKVFSESFTGTTTDRPAFKKLLKTVKEGDTIIFDSVSRMSRTAEEGYQLYQSLVDQGINLVFLKEPTINSDTYKKGLAVSLPETDSAAVKAILDGVKTALQIIQKEQIKQAFEQAQKEVDDLHIRVAEGMRASGAGAKIAEARTGQTYQTAKSVKAKDRIRKLSKAFDGSMKDSEVIELTGISQAQFYRYKKQIKQEILEARKQAEKELLEISRGKHTR